MTNIPVYLINLDTDKERFGYVDAQLRVLGIAYKRFSAVRGLDLPSWLVPYFTGEGDRRFRLLTAGEIGCYASHLSVMKMIIESRQPGLVLEDDVELPPECPRIISEIMDARATWDIVRLSGASKQSRELFDRDLSHGYKLVKYLRVPLRTGAYIITPKGAEKFLTYSTFRHRSIDDDLRRVWECKLISFGVTPVLINQFTLLSTIDHFGPRITIKDISSKHTKRDKFRRAIYNLTTFGAASLISQ